MPDAPLGGFLAAALSRLFDQLDDADRLILTKALELLVAIAAKTETSIDDTIFGFIAETLREAGFDDEELSDVIQTMKPERIQGPEAEAAEL